MDASTHKQINAMLCEMMEGYTRETGKSPSQTTVLELLEWNITQAAKSAGRDERIGENMGHQCLRPINIGRTIKISR